MGQELDELGEYDQEFIENISKCLKKYFCHTFLWLLKVQMYHNF